MRTSTSVAITCFASLASVLAHPLSHLERRDSLSTVYTTCVNSGDFALTFDDGPYQYNSKVVSDLNNAHATGTFFVNGQNYDCIYDRAADLIAAYNDGHVIGSHTWTHADITKLSPAELNSQLTKVETALQKILGIKPRLFRPPYGSYNDAALEVLKQRGYSTVLWSMDSGDSVGKSVAYSESEYEKQAKKFPSPGIGLNHETYESTADTVAPMAIQTLQGAGYKLVSMAECLGLDAYDYIGGKEEKNDSWKC